MLHILVVSDTGFGQDSPPSRGEPDPLKFLSPEKCDSQLQITLYRNTVDRTENTNWWSKIYIPSKTQSVDGIKKFGPYTIPLERLINEEALGKEIEKFVEQAEKELQISGLCNKLI